MTSGGCTTPARPEPASTSSSPGDPVSAPPAPPLTRRCRGPARHPTEEHPMPVLPFESEGQREAYDRLRPMLEALFPAGIRERIHAIGYVYEVEGTTVTTTLAPW